MAKSQIRTAVLATTALVTAIAARVRAQPGVTVSDIEIPTIILNEADTLTASDEALDLANVVQSAAKGVTTVQEAPAIVTVITADELAERQFQDLNGVIDTVPGWQSVGANNGTYPTALSRGQPQAIEFLHDGLSMFEPYVNESSINQVQPMELIKRIEMITGPGGVLWGPNSLLGIVNMITKDAEDVDGIEVGGQFGGGNGDRMYGRAYAMAGAPNLLGGKLKVFAHAAVLTYQGPELTLPLLLFQNALPQPNSTNLYGPLTQTDAAQSMIFTVDGKITYDKLQLRIFAPFGQKYNPAGLSGEPVRKTLPDDSSCTTANPPPAMSTPCVDANHVDRVNREDSYDRYAVAEYRTRFAHESAGVTVRLYGQQFIRGVDPLQVLSPSDAVNGGLVVKTTDNSYRVGAAMDGDGELAPTLRVLYGGEAYHEWAPNNVTDSLQGQGTQVELLGPYDLAAVPLLCPRIYDPSSTAPLHLAPIPGCPLTFAFPASRTVFGAYVDPQYRPTKELIFDLGGRVQVAPASLGTLSYNLNTTVAATMVWNFIPNWHLKLNYAQGFRPPTFAATESNAEAISIPGEPNLKVETSNATQAEINARIFKGTRRIRELTFRIDGSYTEMENLITISSGKYVNSGVRQLVSLEFLGKLYLEGGHRVEFGYTFVRGESSDIGALRSLPQNTFTLAGVWKLIGTQLGATTTLKVTGSTLDPNRLVEYRGIACAANDVVCQTGSFMPSDSVAVLPTDAVLDRLPPIADLTIGVQYHPTPKVSISATAYNALFSHAYQPDIVSDYVPRLEYLPNPYPGFRAILSATYQP